MASEKVKQKKTYPGWVYLLRDKYYTHRVSQFVLHGNIHDYVPVSTNDSTEYHKLEDFLYKDLFKKRDIIVFFDRARGINFRDSEMRKDFQFAVEAYDRKNGTTFAAGWPADPVRAFALLDVYLRIRLQSDKKSMALIIDYAETVIPDSSAANAAAADRNILVFLQKWATEDLFINSDMTIVLVAENAMYINQQYLRNPHNQEIVIPYPNATQRLGYISHYLANKTATQTYLEMTPEVLGQNTAGLALVNLEILLAEINHKQEKFTFDQLNRQKKVIIEGEAGGLLEFVETKYSLKDVAGHKYARKHLMEAAQAIRNGRPEVMPMGYLVSGPVGTGKTFLIKCFSSDIGVPMVMLKNFRSKWVGESEGNLEKVLHLLKAMSPVAVMIDEADAYLGTRNDSGGSGVGSRIFSMLATFMSDTENRGKIIWFLVTARPDLMPVDFKRQGRAEEHIGLFYPESLEEKKELFEVCLKKTGLKNIKISDFQDDFFQTLTVTSGADMEAALTRAKFKAAARGIETDPIVIMEACDDFLPPTYPDEIELMNYAAVLECTSRSLLPEKYKNMTRDEIVEKVNELKLRVS